MAANIMDELLKEFPDLEEGWKEMEERFKKEPAEREMLSLKYRERLEREMLKENLPEPEFTKTKRAESDLKVMKPNAPEMIWVHEQSAMELNVPLKEYHVEYIRADTFIEKAAEWIKNKAENYIVDTSLCSYFDYKRAVEDFKKTIWKESKV